ncbi:hypothetical protein [Moritella sp. F3]|uniref:hypothetical protein n=1 Tax=Moritella sp. F3 TaxID=2718882 RepID=UPI0018E12013|nr:hypothetical protein [Moritella sp. F3]GIC76937.1 hypothetical protein FMO001_16640 [Moritella sp. F1]GIC80120.1 hypothetical protein FMO003_04010 [Moritella sp. F3]
MRKKIEECVNILTGLISDLSVAVEVIKDYEKQPSFHLESKKEFRQSVYRLCFSLIVINCRKYVEFTAKYGQILNAIIPEHQEQKNKYIALINNNTAIKTLRNDYIAHVQSSSTKKALTELEVQNSIVEMIGGVHNALPFLNSISPDNIESTDLEDSLVGTIQLLRDALLDKL